MKIYTFDTKVLYMKIRRGSTCMQFIELTEFNNALEELKKENCFVYKTKGSCDCANCLIVDRNMRLKK